MNRPGIFIPRPFGSEAVLLSYTRILHWSHINETHTYKSLQSDILYLPMLVARACGAEQKEFLSEVCSVE